MKDFLVFWVGDGSSSESRSVYYSHITSAPTKQFAIKKLIMLRYGIDDFTEIDECMRENEETYNDYGAILCDSIRI